MRRAGITLASVFGVGVLAAVVGVVVLVVVAVNSLTGAAKAAVEAPPTCPEVATKTVGGLAVPAGPIGGFCQDRLVNAASVIQAAKALGIGPHTQAVGVMTAIGESSLVNLDHGDAAGPDSRGLFQQRDNGAWGTYEQRMDPYTAASMFYAKLIKVPGWRTMAPTRLAHAVQINSDPDHYAKFWPEAKAIVEGLTGETVPDTVPVG